MKQNDYSILNTERLILRSFDDTDLHHVYKGLSDPDVTKYYGVSFKSLEATKEQIQWFRNLEKNDTGIWWAICSKDDSTFYGAIGFNNLDNSNKKAELGFWLLPKYWKKGILSECMPLVYNYAFQVLDLHRIEAFVETENSNCKKLLKRLKFTYEGTMIDCELKNETFISLAIYSFFKKQTIKG